MADEELRINVLLEGTDLFGGTKVALQHADLAHARGHRVCVVARAARPDWWPLRAGFRTVSRFSSDEVPPADVQVATYWTTLAPASALPGTAVHLCQGFEALFDHNRSEHDAIVAAYRCDVPALVVSPHLATLLRERFGRRTWVLPQPLEPFWSPDNGRVAPGVPPRILVVGPWEIAWKGVETALRAVGRLRRRGLDCRLVRLSQWPLSKTERALLEPDEYHHRLLPAAAADLVRGCDLLFAASGEAEGFGLPALEAMASGVPVIASDVGCYRAWSGDGAARVDAGDPAALADAGQRLLDTEMWRSARARGLAAASAHTGEGAAAAFEAAIRDVVRPPAIAQGSAADGA